MHTLQPADLAGLVPAIVTPFSEDFALDEDALARYVRWLARQPVVALAINTEAGEQALLLPEERRRVLEVAANELGGRRPLIMGVNAAYTGDAVRQSVEARERGASALLAFPVPFSAGLPDEVLIAHFAAMSEAADLPLVLFQRRPAVGGITYSRAFLHALAARVPVIAMKEASFDPSVFIDSVNALGSAPRPMTLLTGNDLFIAESFLFGAQGGLLALSTIAVDLQAELLRAARAGDRDQVLRLRARLQPLAEAVFGEPLRNMRVRLKMALQELSVLPNAVVRPPAASPGPQELARLRAALADAEPALAQATAG